MSGKDAVRDLRERGMRPAPADLGPVLRTIGFAVLAFVVGGGAVFGGVKLLTGGPAPAAATAEPAVAVAMVTEIPAWNPTDTAICRRAYNSVDKAERDASRAQKESGALFAGAGTGKVAPIAAELSCLAKTKPERLCDTEQKAVFVAAVQAYLERLSHTQQIMGLTEESIFLNAPRNADGSEHPAATIIGGVTEGLGKRVRTAHAKVATSLRGLVEAGYLRPDDFGGVMGFGVPRTIKDMLDGTTPGPSVCA